MAVTAQVDKLPQLSLWRNRDYMLLWSGQFVSILGSGISGIAYPLLVLHITHSPAQAGLLDAFGSLPFLPFSAFRMVAFGFQPIGAAAGGILIQAYGPKPVVLVFAAVMIALAILTVANGHIRRAKPITEIQAR